MHIQKAVQGLSLVIFLSACNLSPYTISLNNNVLFNPPLDTQQETFSDPALQACVNNYLNENPEESLQTLSILSCTDAEIESLLGLEKVTSLTLLDLSNNNISDLGPIRGLDNLRVLRASNNRIRNVSALNDLNILNFIDLSGNNEIPCRQLDRLEEKLRNSLLRPLSCN